MNIVIPMVGIGKRFLRAGYTTHKPLITVDGMPIIQHIVNKFSKDDLFIFGVNQDCAQSTPMVPLLKKIAPHGTIVPMPYQEKGVVAVLARLFSYIPDDEEVIVNYCDFSWQWDYEDFKKKIGSYHPDGAVICYSGFHPHLLSSNLYATLDVTPDGLWMREIKEKHSWHADKTQDWTSSGTYYFKVGADLKKYCSQLMLKPELKIHGEYYVSLLFQLMKQDDKSIFVYKIPFMLQWGTPEDLERYKYWSGYFLKKNHFEPKRVNPGLAVLVLMAGEGRRFKEAGYSVEKPYISVGGLPMVVRSARSLPLADKYVFITRKELENREIESILLSNFKNAQIWSNPGITQGQACTALLMKNSLNPDAPLLIGACDYTMLYDEDAWAGLTLKDSPVDALIFTYRNNPMVRLNPEMYGWVETDGSPRAKKVSVKVPLEGDPLSHHTIIGTFWFRKARFYFENAEHMVQANDRINNEFYIDHCMNYLIKASLNVHVFEVDQYISYGTPNDLLTYNYWQAYFNESRTHV